MILPLLFISITSLIISCTISLICTNMYKLNAFTCSWQYIHASYYFLIHLNLIITHTVLTILFTTRLYMPTADRPGIQKVTRILWSPSLYLLTASCVFSASRGVLNSTIPTPTGLPFNWTSYKVKGHNITSLCVTKFIIYAHFLIYGSWHQEIAQSDY